MTTLITPSTSLYRGRRGRRDGEDAETETLHMSGDDCTRGHGLAIEDGRVL